jgi:hypothetical protein
MLRGSVGVVADDEFEKPVVKVMVDVAETSACSREDGWTEVVYWPGSST